MVDPISKKYLVLGLHRLDRRGIRYVTKHWSYKL